MANKYIIDRRQNPKGKSLSNRQRFIRRSKSNIKERIKKNILDRSISDKNSEEVSISSENINEPSFSHDFKTGDYDFILPGNTDYVPGDLISKPEQGEGKGSQATDNGEGNDDFIFSITRDEYLDIVFDDLELPNLKEKNTKEVKSFDTVKGGYVKEGNPTQLNVLQSNINSLGRRLALRKKKRKRELEELKNSLMMTGSLKQKKIILEEIEKLEKKLKSIPFIDPIDIRYNNFIKIPRPTTRAVMVCIMDVSGSMGETEKEIAKRFYFLLYLFLERKYSEVDIVFIRHHSLAKECNEEEFFHSQETGGTIVSSGFELAKEIIEKRYPSSDWNIYIAQASDGDNFSYDMPKLENVLNNNLLDKISYFMYIEICALQLYMHSSAYENAATNMWNSYLELKNKWDNIVCKKIEKNSDIIPVFREVFTPSKDGNNE